MADAFMSQISAFGCTYAPREWILCNGAILSISQYSALFSLLSTNFGGDGRTNFGIPNLIGRSPVGWGSGNHLGETAGADRFQITSAQQLPVHKHNAIFTSGGVTVDVETKLNVSTASGDKKTPNGKFLAKGLNSEQSANDFNFADSATDEATLGGLETTASGTLTGGAIEIEPTGESDPIYHRSPYQVVNYSICVQGVFPPRD